MATHNLSNKNSLNITTLILLCVGYFIDFYDLTIFSSGYSSIIPSVFNINQADEIQLTYLKITSFYTLGILAGSLAFGILSDKFGRAAIIKFSILLYSLATFITIFIHSLPVFILVRFLTGFGLATEFTTSSILIAESLPSASTTRYTSILYISGILGGITANFLAYLPWKIMFIFGGLSGFILYLSRKRLIESKAFIKSKQYPHKSSVLILFLSIKNLLKIFRLFLLILPFNFLLSIMFVLPNFMPLNLPLKSAIFLLLTGYFVGNIISIIIAMYIVNYYKSYKIYLIINSFLFGIIVSIFHIISIKLFFAYSIGLGLLSSGLPMVWIQVVNKSFNLEIRNTAANTLFALGRSATLVCNIGISLVLTNHYNFISLVIISTLIITASTLLAIRLTPESYNKNIHSSLKI